MKLVATTGIGRSEKKNSPLKLLEKLDYYHNIFDWQQFVENISDPLKEYHTSYGSKGARKTRGWMYEYAFDATSYEKTKPIILEALHETIKTMGGDDITLIAHSWGTVIMYDYLVKYKPINVIKLITLGCPIPYNRGNDYDGIAGVDWYNFYEENDAIAHKLDRRWINDIDFESKHWLMKWNLLSHMSYFRSRKLAKMIRKILES